MNATMETDIDAILLNESDNVAVCLRDLEKKSKIRVKTGADQYVILAETTIERGHKVAVTDIQKGASIIKYSEIIGTAVNAIRKGEHVHTHNITD